MHTLKIYIYICILYIIPSRPKANTSNSRFEDRKKRKEGRNGQKDEKERRKRMIDVSEGRKGVPYIVLLKGTEPPSTPVRKRASISSPNLFLDLRFFRSGSALAPFTSKSSTMS